jgi:hypothetical protein
MYEEVGADRGRRQKCSTSGDRDGMSQSLKSAMLLIEGSLKLRWLVHIISRRAM